MIGPKTLDRRLTAVVRSAVFLALFTCDIAAAQDFERIAPKQVPRPGQTGAESARNPRLALPDTAPRVAALKALVFLDDPASVKRAGLDVPPGLDVTRIPDLQDPAFAARMARYLDKPVSLASIDALIRDVIGYYEERDRPFVVVTSPEQDITNGVLQLLVVEGKVGQVKVVGAKVFDEKLYRSGLGLKPGDPIDRRKLDADVQFLNRNPFRDVTAQLEPGQAFGTTDILLRTKERDPLRLYAGYDNTGTRSADTNRVLAGVNWGNVFGLGHELSYQLTASPNFDNFLAHSATYIAPLPWHHLLTLFGSYADIKGKDTGPFNLKGHSHQLGVRYEIPLTRVDGLTHSLVAGLDYKRTNNNLEFGLATVSASGADVAQGVVAYQGRLVDAWGASAFSASVFLSPGGLTGRNSDTAFQTLRAFARSDYAYTNVQMQRITRLPAGYTWHVSAEAQLASANLLGSEQLGAGGFASVRGYDEREANGDEGYVLRNELHTPAFNFESVLPGRRAQLELLTFVDYGFVHNKHLLPGEPRHVELASAGVGTRFSVDQNVSFRFDYGWQLRDDGVPGGTRHGRPHIALLVSY